MNISSSVRKLYTYNVVYIINSTILNSYFKVEKFAFRDAHNAGHNTLDIKRLLSLRNLNLSTLLQMLRRFLMKVFIFFFSANV